MCEADIFVHTLELYELHPGKMYLKHLVERVESWWAPPWVGWVGGHPPGWSKLQMVDAWMGAPAAWRDHPTPAPCLLPSIHSGPVKDRL